MNISKISEMVEFCSSAYFTMFSRVGLIVFWIHASFCQTTAPGGCRLDEFMVNESLAELYHVDNSTLIRTVSNDDELAYQKFSHYSSCIEGYTTEGESLSYSIVFEYNQLPSKNHMMLTCGDDSNWLPVESRIGHMAVCQPFWWRHRRNEEKNGVVGTVTLGWTEGHMYNKPCGTTIEFRILIPPLNPTEVILNYGVTLGFSTTLKNRELILSISGSVPGRDDRKPNETNYYFFLTYQLLENCDGAIELKKEINATIDNTDMIEYYFSFQILESFQAESTSKNDAYTYKISFGRINDDGQNEHFLSDQYKTPHIFNVQQLSLKTNRQTGVTLRKPLLSLPSQFETDVSNTDNETLSCLIAQIRLQRFYDINRKCYNNNSYDITWLETCCNTVLSGEVLDINKLIIAITLYKSLLENAIASEGTTDTTVSKSTSTKISIDDETGVSLELGIALIAVSFFVLLTCFFVVYHVYECLTRDSDDGSTNGSHSSSFQQLTKNSSEPKLPMRFNTELPTVEDDEELSNQTIEDLKKLLDEDTLSLHETTDKPTNLSATEKPSSGSNKTGDSITPVLTKSSSDAKTLTDTKTSDDTQASTLPPNKIQKLTN